MLQARAKLHFNKPAVEGLKITLVLEAHDEMMTTIAILLRSRDIVAFS